MSKKFHKKYKEIQKLQTLHPSEVVSNTPASSATPSDISVTPMATHLTLHEVIRKDITLLGMVIVFMFLILFLVRWIILTTGFEQSLFSLFQKVV